MFADTQLAFDQLVSQLAFAAVSKISDIEKGTQIELQRRGSLYSHNKKINTNLHRKSKYRFHIKTS